MLGSGGRGKIRDDRITRVCLRMTLMSEGKLGVALESLQGLRDLT